MPYKDFFKQAKIQWLLLTFFALTILSINVWSDGIYSAQEGRAALVARGSPDQPPITDCPPK